MNNQPTEAGPAAAASPVHDRFPTAYTILFVLIVVMAALTWVLPEWRADVSSLRKVLKTKRTTGLEPENENDAES